MAGFESHDLAAVWLGHATVLLRLGGPRGLTILTDPVFSDRVGIRLGPVTVGMPRLRPLPLEPGSLPPVDLILLSHAHFDHLDKPTLRRLVSSRTTVITARRTRRLIPRGFDRVIEMDWSSGFTLGGRSSLHLSAHRPRHQGARFACDRRRGVNSYLIEQPTNRAESRRIFFAGDTAHTDAFNNIGPVDLAIFGIGAYGHWDHAHANPEEVWSMFSAMRCHGLAPRQPVPRSHLLPMHHSTFELGGEHPDEPLRRLVAAAGAESDRIVARTMGALWTAPAPPRRLAV